MTKTVRVMETSDRENWEYKEYGGKALQPLNASQVSTRAGKANKK